MFKFELEALDKFLNSLDYPTDRQHILDVATQAELPPAIPPLLTRLDDRHFDSPQDVEKELVKKHT